MDGKLKVLWLCHFSNAFVKQRLRTGGSPILRLWKRAKHGKTGNEVPEFALWITNAIKEFEKFQDDVELHVVSPYPFLRTRLQEFSGNGIHYHFFRNEEDSLWSYIYRTVFKPKYLSYNKNCKIMGDIAAQVKPDVVHLFGAENPDYALGLFSMPADAVSIVQMQTLLNDPDFRKNYPMQPWIYEYRAQVEREVLKGADFIGTNARKFREIIGRDILPGVRILSTSLALQEPIAEDSAEKEFDFVYFAFDISKAADLALEAFGMAYLQRPDITLDIIGKYDPAYKQQLDAIIRQYGMEEAVRFEGKLESHEDVISQIRKARFALLPLKIDLTSGTIREAMSNGLPVITTDTGELGTQKLNQPQQCVMLSDVGDSEALADNMLKLLDDSELAETLRRNSYRRRLEGRSNENVALRYVEAYRACLDHKRNGTPVPEELFTV